MKKLILFTIFVLFAISSIACKSDKKAYKTQKSKSSIEELNISAATSLKDCFTEIESVYLKSNPNTKILLNFGASGTLQHQIEQGAPIDIFISAGKKQIDELESKNLLLSGSISNLLTNSIVIVVPNDSYIQNIEDLESKAKKIAQGEPNSVPVGHYSEEVLKYYKLKDKISDKIIYGKDAKEVLTWVETGNVDVGFVFKTDYLLSKKVKIILEAPTESHEPIIYPMAIIKESKQEKLANEFIKFLKSNESKIIFEKYGFTMTN